MRQNLRAIWIALALTPLLASCFTFPRSVQLEVKDDLSSSIQIVISTGLPSVLGDSAPIVGGIVGGPVGDAVSSAIMGAVKARSVDKTGEPSLSLREQIQKRAQECGATVKVFPDPELRGYFQIQVNQSFTTQMDLEAAAQCASMRNAPPKVSISTTDSLLYRTTKLAIVWPIGIAASMNSSPFPNSMVITLPGKIAIAKSAVTPALANLEYRILGDNRVSFSLKRDADAVVKYRRTLCAGTPEPCDLASAPVEKQFFKAEIELEGSRPKWDIGTILAVVGALFGSGLVFQIGKLAGKRNGASDA